MDKSFHCRAFGLAIRSALPIPGAMAIAPDDPQDFDIADLEILEGPAALTGPCAQIGPYRFGHDTLLFERPGTARYLCANGERIVVQPFAGADAFEVSASLAATAIPAALWMRGEIVMHAAGVVLPGSTRALAIGGSSGSGKSTVLSQLVARGARVVGDDTLCLRFRGGSVQVSGLAASYFLGDAKAGAEKERALCPVPKAQQLLSAELAAFALLALPRIPEDIAFKKLQGVSAFEALLDSRHRPRVPWLLRNSAGLLPKFAQITKQIPVCSWFRRERVTALDTCEIAFLNTVSTIGDQSDNKKKRRTV